MEAQPMPIRRRGMPAELMNELFGSLPLENAFRLLAQMPNGLLARNAQKMIIGIKEAMKNNKLNENDCGSGLTISDEGLTAKHSGPDESKCIRTVLPVPSLNLKINKPRIAFYFEVHILNATMPIYIGFCDHQFPLEGECLGWGDNSNSIGIRRKDILLIEGHMANFGSIFEPRERFFKKGDVIGLGIIQQPNLSLECFATCNAELLGKQSLPPKFTNIQLFPAIILHDADDSIRANFGKDEWKFKNFRSAIE